MPFKYIYLLLSSTLVHTSSVTTVKMDVGNDFFFLCPLTFYSFSGYSYTTQITLDTKTDFDIAIWPPVSGNMKFIMTVQNFDNNLIVNCKIITAATVWDKSIFYKFTTEVRTASTNKSLETPEVHYYHEGDRYYFECVHNKSADINWIKVDDNNTIQAANHIQTSRLIEPFDLTAADNGMKLYCFYFHCTPAPDNTMQCRRIILKSVTLRLNMDITTPIPQWSSILALVCFWISSVTIVILVFIIWTLFRKLARQSSSQAAVPEDRNLYENQNFEHFNMDYADLDLNQTNEQLPSGDDSVYTEVNGSRGADKIKKKRKYCFY